MKKPKVSIIIPTYNMGHYITTAIESIFFQIYKNYEIIVVDDGSTDNTEEILSQYGNKIRIISQNHKGLACARNLGIRNSRGEYIALLDADDAWLPNRLLKQVPILDNKPRIGLVHSNLIEIDDNGNTLGISSQTKRLTTNSIALNLLFRSQHILCPTVLLRKKCLQDVGVFDENLSWFGVEDRDLWIRIAMHWKIEYINIPLALYRIRHDAMSKNIKKMMKARYYIVKKYTKNLFGFSLLRQRMLSAIHLELADGLAWRGNPDKSLQEYFKAIKLFPFNIIIYVNFLKAFIKTFLKEK